MQSPTVVPISRLSRIQAVRISISLSKRSAFEGCANAGKARVLHILHHTIGRTQFLSSARVSAVCNSGSVRYEGIWASLIQPKPT